MKITKKKIIASIVALCVIAPSVAVAKGSDILAGIDARSNATKPYIPPWPSVEYQNYTKAQQLYASATTIIWCTTTWGNDSAPMFTVPIKGKLTSSSVSFFPSTRAYKPSDDGSGEYTPERRSLDGMYHGSPPPYRYGFTPGGQYVDFSGMEVFCTTSLTKFQREKTTISVVNDAAGIAATDKAEAALKAGNAADAQNALTGLETK